MDRLKKKVALVTGAGQGIGRAISELFAQEGAWVFSADLDGVRAEEVAAGIQAAGGRTRGVQLDVSQADSVESVVSDIEKEAGCIDILVNNAGIYSMYRSADCPEAEWDRIFAVNVKGVFLCSRAVMRNMVERRTGKIINLTSLAAKTGGLTASPPYAASKAAVSAYTISLARELGPSGICVNALAPGIINTPMTRDHPASRDGAIVLGRRGEPMDVARAALFLASGDSDYITGEILDVNGGAWMD